MSECAAKPYKYNLCPLVAIAYITLRPRLDFRNYRYQQHRESIFGLDINVMFYFTWDQLLYIRHDKDTPRLYCSTYKIHLRKMYYTDYKYL